MTTDADLDFDRQLIAWLDTATPTRAPDDLVTEAFGRTARTRQRPGWLTRERLTSMQSTLRLTHVPRPLMILVIVATLVVALVGLLIVTGVGSRLLPAPHRPIAFTSTRDGTPEIYVMSEDGSNIIQLTTGGDNQVADWSPDGTQLLFASTRDGHAEVYVMRADGTGHTRLTHSSHGTNGARWSPDGRRIAYDEDTTDNGCHELFMMNADGSNKTQLTPDGDCNWGPAWSPDGNTLAFGTTRDPNFEIWTMRPDGSNQRLLESNPARSDAFPEYSPDGTKIVFTSWTPDLAATSAEVVVMNADGTHRIALTQNSVEDSYPTWSPDGRIVFQSARDGRLALYVCNPDGSNVTRLTTSSGEETGRAWLRPSP